jgi:hypothetical protein
MIQHLHITWWAERLVNSFRWCNVAKTFAQVCSLRIKHVTHRVYRFSDVSYSGYHDESFCPQQTRQPWPISNQKTVVQSYIFLSWKYIFHFANKSHTYHCTSIQPSHCQVADDIVMFQIGTLHNTLKLSPAWPLCRMQSTATITSSITSLLFNDKNRKAGTLIQFVLSKQTTSVTASK